MITSSSTQATPTVRPCEAERQTQCVDRICHSGKVAPTLNTLNQWPCAHDQSQLRGSPGCDVASARCRVLYLILRLTFFQPQFKAQCLEQINRCWFRGYIGQQECRPSSPAESTQISRLYVSNAFCASVCSNAILAIGFASALGNGRQTVQQRPTVTPFRLAVAPQAAKPETDARIGRLRHGYPSKDG